jgi:hypothetical protein
MGAIDLIGLLVELDVLAYRHRREISRLYE